MLDVVNGREIAERLGVSTETIRNWHRLGRMPEPATGGKGPKPYLWDNDVIDKWIANDPPQGPRWLTAGEVDEVAVIRRRDGDKTIKLNYLERRELVMSTPGMSAKLQAELAGCTPRTICRIRAELRA